MNLPIENRGFLSSAAALAEGKRRQVSRLISPGSKASRCVHPQGDGARVGDVPEEPRQWCAFEYADLMEQGRSSGPSTDFMEIPQEEARVCVELSEDKKEFLLTSEDGQNILLARRNNDDDGFGIFFVHDGEPPRALGPAFTLTRNKASDKTWTLYASTCDQCECQGRRNCGRRELANFNQHIEEVGEAKICCMEVEIPAVSQEGVIDVWCPMCRGQADQECIELTSRRPKWNNRRKALMMDFFGRVSEASVRNIMLELPEDSDAQQPKETQTHKLLFGKVGPNQYVLDFSKPLSMVQAFAMAVFTSVFK